MDLDVGCLVFGVWGVVCEVWSVGVYVGMCCLGGLRVWYCGSVVWCLRFGVWGVWCICCGLYCGVLNVVDMVLRFVV